MTTSGKASSDRFRFRRKGESYRHYGDCLRTYKYWLDVQAASWADWGDIKGAYRLYLAAEGGPGGGLSIVADRAREPVPEWARAKPRRQPSGYDR